MRRRFSTPWLFLVAASCCLGGCGSSMKATQFSNPNFDFSFVERVAVLPFENLSSDRQAGLRATRLTVTELLASGALDVVERGEVQAALTQTETFQPGRTPMPNTEQVISLGQALGVQAIIMGTVTQSENLRSGSVLIPVVTIDMRMVEAETGATVWAATHSE
ncbi:MAG: CsgG/HfaB family protein, partial [Thermoanaerobaculia bacterium]